MKKDVFGSKLYTNRKKKTNNNNFKENLLVILKNFVQLAIGRAIRKLQRTKLNIFKVFIWKNSNNFRKFLVTHGKPVSIVFITSCSRLL